MAEAWQDAITRAQQTQGVWSTFDASFKIGTLDKAAHAALIPPILALVYGRAPLQDQLDDALQTRDALLRRIADLGVRLPGLMQAELPEDDPLQSDFGDIFSVQPNDSDAETIERARRVVSMWNRFNARRGAASPPQPALMFEDIESGDLQDMTANYSDLQQTIENKRGALADNRLDLRSATRILDRANKRWYKGWFNAHAPGSDEREALNAINTGDDTHAPDDLDILSAVAQPDRTVRLTYEPGDAEGASELRLLHQIVGVDADFAHPSPVVVEGQISGPFPIGAVVNFVTRASNSAGTTQSEPVSVTVG